ncbi:MAG: type I DNA topoisomerase [Patescibacteria group bacterium]|jgi:DNA topoisomerase-1
MPKTLQKLIIVESPTKAKTITKFLGSDFKIDSSYGHVRDLPKKKLGVDLEHDFAPEYVIFKENQKRITALKKLAAKADEVYYATDEDREGEAISWHLSEIFNLPKSKERRIAFHEITKEAILAALDHPRQIDMNLVDAQQARRVLDRLVGYKISPFLWKKVAKGLSAGRVQSVAVRLIIEREREITAFNKEEYWSVEADFKKPSDGEFRGKLHRVGGQMLDKMAIKDQATADNYLEQLNSAKYQVAKVEKKETQKNPLPPFTTSTLQQDANRRLGFSAKQTMMIAQQLYEGVVLGGEGQVGLISYMRTDSLNLSEKFLGEASEFIKKNYGADFGLEAPRHFKTKSKGAQEAHEAIRPTEVYRQPEEMKDHLTPQQYKLYNLIWRRAVASQMAVAVLANTAVDVSNDKNDLVFRATGQVIKFAGFLSAYPSGGQDIILPDLTEGEKLDLLKIEPLQHFTQPPARYSDATLVKALEEKGIGRPSTYAPTINTIITRGYVSREEKRLKPAEIAFLVNDLLVEHFPEIVDYDFTAKMEGELDEIAAGELKWQPVIKKFYGPFSENLEKKYGELNKEDIVNQETSEVCDKCGKPMIIKIGRFGKFLACTGFPECKNTKQINGAGEIEPEETLDEKCPNCGKPMVYKHGRFGKFIACSDYPKCKTTKQVLKTIGMKCPECKEGEVVIRHGRGRVFYGCSRYPDCKFTSWKKPGEAEKSGEGEA